MFVWERFKQQLEQILGAELRLERLQIAKWHSAIEEETGAAAKSRIIDGRLYFHLYKEAGHIWAASVEEHALTESEKQLVELLLEAHQSQEKRSSTSAYTEDERRALSLRGWVQYQLEQGVDDAELPEGFTASMALETIKIPLLIYGDYSDPRKAAYKDLKKLLDSFFDGEIILVPLQEKEWLILGPESLLQESGEGEDESKEDMLASLGHALHEMLATEWVGECRIAVDVPMLPSKSLLAAVVRLREAMALGRKYHVEDNIHMLWKLQLEKLLQTIGEEQKQQFLQKALKRIELLKDPEMLTTLEQFIALDCSVSDTAKKLFIHRNTLVYRLDKFKQETGLDVRAFHHAVLVHVALLLYKVTKRV